MVDRSPWKVCNSWCRSSEIDPAKWEGYGSSPLLRAAALVRSAWLVNPPASRTEEGKDAVFYLVLVLQCVFRATLCSGTP